MSSTFLVSFSNLMPKELALGIYDYENEGFRWVDLSIDKNGEKGMEIVYGGVGLCEREGDYWAIVQANAPAQHWSLLRIDHHGNLLNKYLLQDIRDPHSMMPYENGFLVVDTGFNRLLYYELSGDGTLQRSVFWQSVESDKDEVHLNSLAIYQGDIYISMFGNMPGEMWSSANAGSIINIRTGQVICQQLMQPHSLIVIDEYLYWLESQQSLVHRYSPGTGHEIVKELPGYVRGIAADDKYIYISASARRRKSKSTGAMSSTPTESKELHHSRIYRLAKATHESVDERIITCFGAETYDILPIKEIDDIPSHAEAQLAIIRRLWQFEDTVYDTIKKHQDTVKALENDRDSRLQQLLDEKKEAIDKLTFEKDNAIEQLSNEKDSLIQQKTIEIDHLEHELQIEKAVNKQLNSQLGGVLKSKRWKYSTRISSLLQKLFKGRGKSDAY